MGVTTATFTPDGRRAVTGSADGTVRLWDPATGEELCRLILLGPGSDWLALTPEGRFAGSEAGRQKLHFRRDGVAVPAERLPRLFRPRLLQEVIVGRPKP
jgi:hypothetical protein